MDVSCSSVQRARNNDHDLFNDGMEIIAEENVMGKKNQLIIWGLVTYNGTKVIWGTNKWNASSGKLLAASQAEIVPGEAKKSPRFSIQEV